MSCLRGSFPVVSPLLPRRLKGHLTLKNFENRGGVGDVAERRDSLVALHGIRARLIRGEKGERAVKARQRFSLVNFLL